MTKKLDGYVEKLCVEAKLASKSVSTADYNAKNLALLAIADKIRKELGWMPSESFSSGIRKTINWYLEHQEWTDNIIGGAYRAWIRKNYS